MLDSAAVCVLYSICSIKGVSPFEIITIGDI